MPGYLDIIYYSILFSAIFFSFLATTKNMEGLVFLRILLVIEFLYEMIVLVFKIKNYQDHFPHYFYIPAEYLLLVLFYRKYSSGKLLLGLMYGSVLLVFVTFIYKISAYDLNIYPISLYNIIGGLNTFWTAILLLNIKAKDGLNITDIPLFWILTALLLFYSGIFFFNIGYFIVINQEEKPAALLRNFISTTMNILLYLLFIYGFICSFKTRKY